MYPNSSLYFWLVQPKIMSSTYIWHTNSSPSYVFVKSVGSRDPGLKPFLFRKSLIVSYHARGACLRPYSALFILKARWLSDIYFFFNLAIEKCTLHIHLI